MIPIGPDFQDPAASPNYPPVLHDESPLAGSTLTVALDMRPEVRVFATDPNAGDSLYYEWALDYPPFASQTTHVLMQPPLPAPTSGPQTRVISLTLTCDTGFVLNGPTQRRLQLILSDRPLNLDLSAQTSSPEDPLARLEWTVALNCPVTGSP